MSPRRPPFLILALLAVVATSCTKASMGPEQATQVAVEAFASAGLAPEVGEIVEDATVDRAIDGNFIQVHQVELIIDDRPYLAGVDRKQGAVVRLIEPNDSALTDSEVQTIAEYRDNPAERDARRSRTVAGILIVLLGIAGAIAFFRRERLKSEVDDNVDEIPLT